MPKFQEHSNGEACRHFVCQKVRKSGGNMHALETFKTQVTRMWYKSLRRRSQKTKLTWVKMNGIVQKWIPKAKILHPWPEERFERYTPKVRA